MDLYDRLAASRQEKQRLRDRVEDLSELAHSAKRIFTYLQEEGIVPPGFVMEEAPPEQPERDEEQDGDQGNQ